MNKVSHNYRAVCERGNSQEGSEHGIKADKSRLCAIRQKPCSLKNSALLLPPELSFIGFFTSSASDAIDNTPTWASCTGYIGMNLSRMTKPSRRSYTERTSSEPPSYPRPSDYCNRYAHLSCFTG